MFNKSKSSYTFVPQKLMQADDLKKGQTIAITGPKEFDPVDGITIRPDLIGAPMKVKAVSLPFIVVELNGQIEGADMRRFNFVRVNRQYVNAMKHRQPVGNGQSHAILEPKGPIDKDHCPNCGDRYVLRNDGTGWVKWCRQCDGE